MPIFVYQAHSRHRNSSRIGRAGPGSKPNIAPSQTITVGVKVRVGPSNLGSLKHRQRIPGIHTQVAHRALKLRMAEQDLQRELGPDESPFIPGHQGSGSRGRSSWFEVSMMISLRRMAAGDEHQRSWPLSRSWLERLDVRNDA